MTEPSKALTSLDPGETASFRTVYLLAISALDRIHDVDEQMLICLADSVFEAYPYRDSLPESSDAFGAPAGRGR